LGNYTRSIITELEIKLMNQYNSSIYKNEIELKTKVMKPGYDDDDDE